MGWLIYHAWNIYRTRFSSLRDSEESRYAALVAEARSAGPSEVVRPVLTPRAPREQALLDAAERVTYFNLKLALPDYEILARVDPQALVTGDTMVPRAPIDFLVCKKDFTPDTAIMLVRGSEEDPLRERVARLLAQSGLRVLRWPVRQLPKREGTRAAVFSPH
ncbi:MAG: hypothetical protein QM639_05175 [Rhodocyclaceae bacterium]